MDNQEVLTKFDLEYFFDLSPDLICIAGFDGYFRKINPAVSKTLKYSHAELMDRPISSFIHMEDRNATAVTRNDVKKGIPLINFENRYITKDGDIVWLEWTSIPIAEQQVIFAIAKNITAKKMAQADEHKPETEGGKQARNLVRTSSKEVDTIYSSSDKAWLDKLEALVRSYTGKIDLNLKTLSEEMAIGERQLFRRIKTLIGITPNQYIRLIRLQIALEAIQTGKYKTISEISHIAGFQTPAYFKKLFRQEYRYDVEDLL
jgi:PAS domain S-box-containing protein